MNLSVNQVILWEPQGELEEQFERVLWLSNDMTYMFVINLKTNKFPSIRYYEDVVSAVNIGDAQLVKFRTEPEQISHIDEVREKEIDEMWNVIQEIVAEEPNIYDKAFRGIRARDMQTKWGVSRPTIDSYLKKYWRSGKLKIGLIKRYDLCGGYGTDKIALEETKKRGRPRKITLRYPLKVGINVTQRLADAILYAKSKYIENEKLGYKQAFEKMKRKFFVDEYTVVDGEEVPRLLPEEQRVEYKTFRYHIKKLEENDPVKSLTNRFGDKKFNLLIRDKTGNNTQTANSPGTRFQIDATIAGVQLVSRYDTSLPIGKPVTYTVLDTFTHIYTGMYVGLEGPSYLGALMAILNTGSSKVKFCEKYGITITEEDWPCFHMPQQFTADRGEMLTKNNWSLRNTLGVDIEYAAPYRADMKPLVESHYNVLNHGLVKRLTGASGMKQRERGMKDPALNAILTIEDFTYMMIIWILKHNRTKYMQGYPIHADMVKDNISPVPLQLWNWGRRNRGSSLRVIDEDILKLNLLPPGTARITDKGLIFKGVPFTCDRAKREGWFLKAFNSNLGREVDIAFDPRWTNNIFLKLEGGLMYEECWMINSDHLAMNKNWDEYEQIMEVLEMKYLEEDKETEEQAQARFDYLVEKRTELARENKRDSGLSESKQLKGRSVNRANEKSNIREEEHFFNKENADHVVDTETRNDSTCSRDVNENVVEKEQVEKQPFPTAAKGKVSSRILALQELQDKRRSKSGGTKHAK
jgi:putative transposase